VNVRLASARRRALDRRASGARRRHAPESAAQHLVERVPIAGPSDAAAAVIESLRGQELGSVENVYVVDGDGKLLGVRTVGDVLRLSPHEPIGPGSTPAPLTVSPDADQEHVANTALRHGLTAVPVADETGRFLGIVPARALLEILRHEHVEDLHRMAGITRENAHARKAMEDPPIRRARDRLPWLLVGLAGSMLATAIVGGFERTLQAQLAVAFFMPGLVYLTDAIGTQSEAIAVRGLSITHRRVGRLLWGELRTGLLLGVVLGSLVFAAVLVAFRDLRLALAVALTVVTAGLTACTVGMGLPWLLARWGRDPAFGSGPLGTIIQDVLTLIIYFAAVTLLM
jgi:magnesium transporter